MKEIGSVERKKNSDNLKLNSFWLWPQRNCCNDLIMWKSLFISCVCEENVLKHSKLTILISVFILLKADLNHYSEWCDTDSLKSTFHVLEFSVFPSSRLVAFPKLKNPVCPTIYPSLRGKKRWIHTFPKGICVKWNANNLT